MKRSLIIILSLLFATMSFAADDIVFKASAPGSVVIGRQFRIEYTVNGDGKDFRAGDFSGLDVKMGPSTSSSTGRTIINGKVTSETSKTFTYIVVAKNEGVVNIPAATIKVDGKTYSSNALTVKVLPQDKASEAQQGSGNNQNANGLGSNDVLCRLVLSKTKAYEGEAVLASIKLLTTNPQTQIQDAKFPSFDGFTVQEIDLPQQKSFDMEHVDGKNYYSVVLKQYLLYPQRSGKIEIAPAMLEVVVPVRTERRMRSIFDDFFDNYENISKTIYSSKLAVDATALPFGKPASFMGGVGDFKISSTISTTEVKANDALTLTLNISGNGNIRFIKDPELKVPADFEVFDPKVDLKIKATSAGVSGTKSIEYTMIPRYAGDFEIPAIDFSYFDLKSNSYKTLTTQSYNIKVEKSASGDSNVGMMNFSGSNQENVKLLGSDIRYIKSGKYNLKKETSFIFGSLFFYLAYIIPIVLFLIFFIVYRKQVQENANIALMKTKKANKVALKRLKTAGIYLKSQDKVKFYDEMLKAIWGYLSDKLNIPTSELTKDNIEDKLKVKGVDHELTERFMNIVSECEFARFAPSQGDGKMDELYNETISAIGKMENVIK